MNRATVQKKRKDASISASSLSDLFQSLTIARIAAGFGSAMQRARAELAGVPKGNRQVKLGRGSDDVQVGES